MDIKTNEELIEEIVEDFGFDKEDDKEKIDKVLELKKDRFKATQKKKEKEELLKKMTKGKEFYKSKTKEKKETKVKKEDPKGTKPLITTEDKAYLFSKGYTRTELRYLEKVMKSEDKKWEKAITDSLFTTWKKENDSKIKRRGSTLGASRGGSSGSTKGDKELIAKWSKNMPTGLAKKSK